MAHKLAFGEDRRQVFQLNLSDELKARLAAAASSLGVGISEFIRLAATRLADDVEHQRVDELRRELQAKRDEERKGLELAAAEQRLEAARQELERLRGQPQRARAGAGAKRRSTGGR